MITLEESKKFLNIDSDDDYYNDILNDFITSSKADIYQSTGVPSNFLETLKEDSDKEMIGGLYKMCQRISISDQFYERDTTNKALLSYYIKLELAYKGAEKV